MKKLDQDGSHLVAVLLGVLVVAVVGFVGYRVAHNMNSTTVANGTSSTSGTTATVRVPSTITSKAQLDQAAQALDGSTSSLNSSLSSDSLNSNLNAML